MLWAEAGLVTRFCMPGSWGCDLRHEGGWHGCSGKCIRRRISSKCTLWATILPAKLVVWRRKNQQNGEEAGGYALSDDERRIFIGYHCPQAARNS
jgi:hypothetical protein